MASGLFRPSSVVLRLAERGLNQVIQWDPGLRQRLTQLEGQSLALRLSQPPLDDTLLLREGGFRLHRGLPFDTDATIEGASLALLRQLGQSSDPGQLMGSSVRIQGDPAFVQQLANVMAEADPDWEEALSRVTGDVAAHQLGRTLRGALQWARQSGQRLAEDTQLYLQEEAPITPARAEVDAFLDDVDTLKLDGERLEARIGRLERRLAGPSGGVSRSE